MLGGFVTRSGSPAEYYVNEHAVSCTPGVTLDVTVTRGKPDLSSKACPQRILGESVAIYGPHNGKNGPVMATRVETDKPIEIAVDGFAIVDRVMTPVTDSTAILRADGYSIQITPATKVTFAQESGLTLDRIGTNVWLRYAGTLKTDGSVVASSALFAPNTTSRVEDKMRSKSEYNAAAVNEEDRQGRLSKYVLGRNPKKIPAYKDDAMQKRIERIGNSLIPAFQRALPPNDPSRIDFRFQLVDEPKERDGLDAPSGIVLMPRQVVQALPDDSQLAAVMSADIAEVMEKQAIRSVPARNMMAGASLAGTAAGLFVPGVSTGVWLANKKARSVIERHHMEQSTRTGLTWMQDAGYDLTQAPLAWWTMADKNRKGLAAVRLPDRTQYLYQVLSTAWRNDLLKK